MDPKEIFKKVRQQPVKKEFAFALQIGLGVVKGAIWGVEAGNSKVFAFGKTAIWQQENQLIEAADQTFSDACEKLSVLEEEEPKKIIFGLPFSWVEGDKILPEKLKVLKRICQDLDLKPVGFVVTMEAIVKYLKTLEGVAPNVILANLAQQDVEVALLRLGKIVGVVIVARSDNLGEDIAEGLSRIETEDVLPSRMILYDSDQEIEEEKEAILGYSWLEGKEKFNFLHLPKVEVVSPEFDIKAVALAGGAEVAKAKGIEAEIPLDEDLVSQEKTEVEEKEITEEKEVLPVGTPTKLDFGFVPEEDITGPEKPLIEISPPVNPPVEASFQSYPVETRKPVIQEEVTVSKRSKLAFPRLRINLTFLVTPFKKIFSWLPLPAKLPLMGMFLGGSLLLLAAGLFCFWWFYPKATITLYVAPQTLEKEFPITLNAQVSDSDPVTMVIPARLVEKVVQNEGEKATTGTKIIGDKAKGEITVYNRTSEQKTLAEGTILIGPQSLKFSLAEKLTIASESAGPDYSQIPGKATIAISAEEIGSEGNLAASSEFEVDKYSKTDLIARNDQALSGGTSREIRVVSETDQKELTASLLEQIRQQVKQQLADSITGEEVLLAESITEKIEKKTFDHDLKEEAEKLKLKLEVSFKALAYQRSVLNRLAEEKIKNSVPSGFEFKAEESQVSFKLSKIISEKEALFEVVYQATLWPKINEEQIRHDLKGKKLEIANFYLSGLTNLSGYNISFNKPKFPSRIITLPQVSKNIRFEIKSK